MHMNISDQLFQIIIAGGGAAVICGGIMTGLSKLTTDALLERFKLSQSQTLEQFKDALARSAARTARYEGAQFGAYQDIWDTLCDLRLAADRLWDRATQRNIDEFGRHFEAVRRLVYGGEILIENPHLATLRQLIADFREF